MKISETTIFIDGEEHPLTMENIEKKLYEYNSNYTEIITRVHILSRVLSQCNEESEHTLI